MTDRVEESTADAAAPQAMSNAVVEDDYVDLIGNV